MLNETKMVALPLMDDTPTSREKALLAEVRIPTTAEGRAVVRLILNFRVLVLTNNYSNLFLISLILLKS